MNSHHSLVARHEEARVGRDEIPRGRSRLKTPRSALLSDAPAIEDFCSFYGALFSPSLEIALLQSLLTINSSYLTREERNTDMLQIRKGGKSERKKETREKRRKKRT